MISVTTLVVFLLTKKLTRGLQVVLDVVDQGWSVECPVVALNIVVKNIPSLFYGEFSGIIDFGCGFSVVKDLYI